MLIRTEASGAHDSPAYGPGSCWMLAVDQLSRAVVGVGPSCDAADLAAECLSTMASF